MRKEALILSIGLMLSSPALAADDNNPGQCSLSRNIVNVIQGQLAVVAQLNNGGLFQPSRMWSAVVDRQGVLCSVIRNDPDAWPGSRAIAIAKASTANDFSNNILALSTANLYSLTQPANNFVGNPPTSVPAGSLYGLNNSNPFNPSFPPRPDVGTAPGGIITFGGGVPLYLNGQVIGGLGVSGDTACADHAIAYRMRRNAGFNGIPTPGNDNIDYLELGELPHDFKHPHCIVGRDIVTP
jgi:uncharacterized protein GlcG (DUF336 family)